MRNRLIALFMLGSVLFTSCSSPREEESGSDEKTAPVANSQPQNDYPNLVLKLANGQEISAGQLKGNNVFVLFQPDCDHCQEEAVLIEQRLEAFKDYTLYFISSAPMEQITSFAQTFQLHDKPNVNFAWTSTDGVLNHYGAIRTPSVYIYADGKLKQSFNGQTDIETIVDAL